MSLRERWRKLSEQELTAFYGQWLHASGADPQRVVYLCIGTDRSTGDALGPLVGSGLAAAGIEAVVGTLAEPCDADNFEQRLRELPPGRPVVVIDACLGAPSSVGKYLAAPGPLEPGRSLGRGMPAVGDCSIAAVVNAEGAKPYSVLQHTSLYRVMGLAEGIVRAITAAHRQ